MREDTFLVTCIIRLVYTLTTLFFMHFLNHAGYVLYQCVLVLHRFTKQIEFKRDMLLNFLLQKWANSGKCFFGLPFFFFDCANLLILKVFNQVAEFKLFLSWENESFAPFVVFVNEKFLAIEYGLIWPGVDLWLATQAKVVKLGHTIAICVFDKLFHFGVEVWVFFSDFIDSIDRNTKHIGLTGGSCTIVYILSHYDSVLAEDWTRDFDII